EAKAWIAEVLANNNGENLPLLGGPTQARLADMLDYYVRHVTVVKGGAVQEINRANHYLLAAGLPALALWQDEEGKREIVTLAERQRRKREAQQNPGATRNRIGSRNAAGTRINIGGWGVIGYPEFPVCCPMTVVFWEFYCHVRLPRHR